jgi:hypothetical protein
MRDLAINNETTKGCNPMPFLTTTSYIGDMTLMAKSKIAKSERICQVEGCESPMLSKGYCRRHYWQVWRNGCIATRTRYTPNEFRVNGNTTTIPLFNMQNDIVCEAIIDTEDIPLVSSRKWCSDKGNYVISGKESLYLHRLIMNANNGQTIDHINHNGLDNRKANLRFCTYVQNMQNSKMSSNNNSGVKNVCKVNGRDRWDVTLRVNGKKKYIGRFNTLEDAKLSAQKSRLKYHGAFACNG